MTPFRSLTIVAVAFGVQVAASAAQAQDRVVLPPGWHAGKVRVVGSRVSGDDASTAVGASGRGADRGLTIRKRFMPDISEPDPLDFSDDRSGDVRLFNPFPAVTSGTQLPYGLDGIGGFGSDIGYSAGAGAALYDRGG